MSRDEMDKRNTGFQPLSEIVLLLRPERSPSHSIANLDSPRIIFLFGFYNGPIHTLQRDYISKYTERWPSASMVVTLGLISWLFKSQKDKDRLLKPAVDLLLGEENELLRRSPGPDAMNGLLFHVLSDGGGFLFTSFTDLLEGRLASIESSGCRASERSGNPHNISINPSAAPGPVAIILDSVPSIGSGAGTPLVASIKSPILKAAALVPATLAFSAIFGAYYVLGVAQPYSAMNARLLRTDVVPGFSDQSTPRLYIYSEGDEVVDYREVEAHVHQIRGTSTQGQRASEIRQASECVLVEKYGSESPHVKHVRTNPERYWTAIGRLWEEALKSSLKDSSFGVRAKL